MVLVVTVKSISFKVFLVVYEVIFSAVICCREKPDVLIFPSECDGVGSDKFRLFSYAFRKYAVIGEYHGRLHSQLGQ